MRVRTFNMEDSVHRCRSEPRELAERKKQFFLIYYQPHAVLRDVGDLNSQSAPPKRF
jgi:hypothetical protein